MAEEDDKKGVGIVGGVASVGAGVGTAAAAATIGFKRLKDGLPEGPKKFLNEGLASMEEKAEEAFGKKYKDADKFAKNVKGEYDKIKNLAKKKFGKKAEKAEEFIKEKFESSNIDGGKSALEAVHAGKTDAKAIHEAGMEGFVAKSTEGKIKDVEKQITKHFEKEAAGKAAKGAEKAAEKGAKKVAEKVSAKAGKATEEVLSESEAIAKRIVTAQKGINSGNFVTRPIAAFKGLGGGGKAAVVGLGAAAVVGTWILASKMFGGSHVDRLNEERANGQGMSRA